jgi:hemerythrin
MLLHWNDAYKTGHPLIDEQHKSIIDAMNRMHEAVEAGKIREEVPGILQFLESYIEEHFGYEERCALHYQCPNATRNEEAHRQFVARFREIRRLYDQEPFSRPQVLDVYYEIMGWIKGHILGIDIPNFHCVREKIDLNAEPNHQS